MEYRYFIKLAYNGKNFHGWQLQNGVITVQEVLNTGLSRLLSSDINVVGCGRTDTGVHAKEFYAHFAIEKNINKKKRNELVFKLNGFLGRDIVIYNIRPVISNAHARFSALSRTYRYYITRIKDPFKTDFTYFLFGELDVEIMNKAAATIKEYEDFTSFSKVNTQVNTKICKIHHAHWQYDNNLLIFEIRADRFLRNMVRAIVGTMIELGQHKISLDGFRKIIEKKDRAHAGYSVPAHGLFLEKVEYPDDIFISG